MSRAPRATRHTNRPKAAPRHQTWRHLVAAASACWLLGGPLTSAAQAVTPPAEPSSDMNGELFYQLLLGELQLQQNDPGSAYSLVLDAANRTGRVELYRRAVEIAMQGRAGNAALSAARNWSQAHPDSDEPYRYELQILLALNRPGEVSQALRQLIRLASPERRADVIGAIPQTLARTPDRPAALQAAQDALRTYLEDPTVAGAAHAALGRMQLAQDDANGALRSAQEGLRRQPNSGAAAMLAVELAEREQPGAATLVQTYLQTTSTQADQHGRRSVQLAYSRVLIDQRRHADAERELAQLIAQHPSLAEPWLLQGILRVQQRQASAAETALQRYLELSRELPADEARRGQTQAFLQLAQLAEQRRDFDAANAWLDRIEDGDALLAAQLRRATVLARQGQIDQARALIRQQPARTDAEVRRRLLTEAQMLRDVGRHDLAFDVFGEAAQRFADDAELAYEHAMAAEKAGRLDEMERLMRQLIARHPDFHHAYNALGYSLADRNERLAEAETLIRQALLSAPNDPFILDSLGWVAFRKGDHAEALRILQDAYQRRPDAEIAAHLGEVHWVLNQRPQALAVWREGLLLNPENETLLNTLRRLQVQP